jgi:hypothetical protein
MCIEVSKCVCNCNKHFTLQMTISTFLHELWNENVCSPFVRLFSLSVPSTQYRMYWKYVLKSSWVISHIDAGLKTDMLENHTVSIIRVIVGSGHEFLIYIYIYIYIHTHTHTHTPVCQYDASSDWYVGWSSGRVSLNSHSSHFRSQTLLLNLQNDLPVSNSFCLLLNLLFLGVFPLYVRGSKNVVIGFHVLLGLKPSLLKMFRCSLISITSLTSRPI